MLLELFYNRFEVVSSLDRFRILTVVITHSDLRNCRECTMKNILWCDADSPYILIAHWKSVFPNLGGFIPPTWVVQLFFGYLPFYGNCGDAGFICSTEDSNPWILFICIMLLRRRLFLS